MLVSLHLLFGLVYFPYNKLQYRKFWVAFDSILELYFSETLTLQIIESLSVMMLKWFFIVFNVR